MKKKLVTLICIFIGLHALAIVDVVGTGYTLPQSYGPACLGQEYVIVGFQTNFETNNATFQIQRSTDPGFSWAITGTAGFNGNFSGCGTCGARNYSVNDYGPWLPGQVWFYRVKATSNFSVDTYHTLTTYTTSVPSVVNWVNQVTSSVTLGSSPATESSYTWSMETKSMQGVSICLVPSEINSIYLETSNNKIDFNANPVWGFVHLDVNVDNGGYYNLYSGPSVTHYIWQNSAASFLSVGLHNLKVKYTVPSGTTYLREYDIYVVSKSDGLYVDNYCNTMRVWKGNDATGGRPLILSEGFDAYNTKPEQYYREAGKDLINCLLNKGFDVYIVNYNLNSQSIKNNAAIFQSAIRYVSAINGNKLVVAAGISMGGVINRLACAKAENDGNPLPLYKFVSLDAPHQGAFISESLQAYIKTINAGNGDTYSDIASNNDAAKELLKEHEFDPASAIHTNFFNYLNALNGDGYPHLVEKIGVSFSTDQPSGYALGDEWLNLQIHTPLKPDKHFFLEQTEIEAGSFLPKLNKDPFIAGPNKYWWLNVSIVLYPFLYPRVDFIQLRYPAFIPHNSSLDITGGVSKFNVVIKPSTTAFHDEVPVEIIEPLVNALIEKNVYVQNKDYNNQTRTIIASEKIHAGNNVTILETAGNVNVIGTSIIKFKAGKEIMLKPGFSVQLGAEFNGIVETITCDGSSEYQNKSVAAGSDDDLQQVNSFDVLSEIVYESTAIAETEVEKEQSGAPIIFPNPASSMVTISTNENDLIKSIKLYDIVGSLIKTVVVPGKLINLDLSDVTKGMYIIEIQTQRNSYKETLIIQ
ncbi:MAG TPA: T9SS type A sorting domain-containing protein [Bacteroidia bacterium]|jgi:hypothetical protein